MCIIDCPVCELQELVGSNVARVVAFNLGYLPSGDKALTTNAATSVAAVEAALEVGLSARGYQR